MCFESRGPFDFNGEHFQLNAAMMDLGSPPDRTAEIWVAAHGPRMLRLTGRYGDGWYPTIPMIPDQCAAKLATIQDAAANAGRNPMAITPGFSMFYAAAASESEAEQLLDGPRCASSRRKCPTPSGTSSVTHIRSVRGFAG